MPSSSAVSLLAALVIGIAAQNLSADAGRRLLANAAGLHALILVFGPVSSGHVNPAVTLVDARPAAGPGAPWPSTSRRR